MDENFDIELELNEEKPLDVSEEGEKKTSLYSAATRAVTFGSLSIILPLFAYLFTLFGSMLVPLLVAGAGLAFAIVGLVSAKKCAEALPDTLSEGMAKTGRAVSIIGLIVSAAVLAWIAAMVIITVVVVVLVVSFYIFVYAIAFFAMMMGV